ncbi:NAD(P)/FAD-dependent oxidoreductase [Roseobacter weihaiensis]|uniref:NAD(P)/FAD-dependent oxidoreductase n=1 Tax=Roseobacter weihaiensis TaxID=2763262 RepID=UPI001D0B9D24|nr:FAD-dependent oxidoreductase [Roseobacter sp. H9]
MKKTSDVLVIGAGVYGTSVAYSFAKRGCSVTLIDASKPGKATAASAGGLWAIGESVGLGCGVIFHNADEVSSTEPEPVPRLFMHLLKASNKMFAELAPELLLQTGMDIEAEVGTGLLYLLYNGRQRRHAQSILDWLGRDQALAEEWDRQRVLAHDPHITDDVLGAVHFPGDNQVNPLFLNEALKRAAINLGARFAGDTHVTDLLMADGKITGVATTQGVFCSGLVINAAGAWAAKLANMIDQDIPLVPVRGQIIGTETLQDKLKSNISTVDCYILQKAHGEVLIGSTTEMVGFDTGVNYEMLTDLARGAIRAIPALERVNIKRTWSGLRPGTPDELPVLGQSPEIANFHYATGGFRTGIVSAPLCGELVVANALGEKPRMSINPFLPRRFNGLPKLKHVKTPRSAIQPDAAPPQSV